MDSYTAYIKAYLAENQPNYGCGDFKTLLGFLYWHYTEMNPIENEEIRRKFLEMERYFRHLSADEEDEAFDKMCELYLENEQLAFSAGLGVGMRLAMELTEKMP